MVSVRLPKEFPAKAFIDFAAANGRRVVWRQPDMMRRGNLIERYDKMEMWVVAGLAFYLGVCVGASLFT